MAPTILNYLHTKLLNTHQSCWEGYESREGETLCNILSGASVLLYHSLNVITVVNAAVKGRKASLSVLLIRTVPSKPIFTIKKLFLHLLGWKCSFKPLTLIEQLCCLVGDSEWKRKIRRRNER
jgi:hypothetical protein